MFFGHSVILFCFIANFYFFGSSADEDKKCPICQEELEGNEEEILYDCDHRIHKKCENPSKKNFCFVCTKAVKPKPAEQQAPAPSGQIHSAGGAAHSTSNSSQTHQTRAGRTHQPSSSGHSSNPSANRGQAPPTHLNEDLDRQIALSLSHYADDGPMSTANDAQIAENMQKQWQEDQEKADEELARSLDGQQ